MAAQDKKKKSINFKDIKLSVGEKIQLQNPADDSKDRIFVKLLGYREGKSIIVTSPQVAGKPIPVEKGHKFIVRLFSIKTVYAFNVAVLDTKRSPYPYMHLTYPLAVESVVVRSAQRVGVELIVSVQNEDPDKALKEAVSAKLTDISTGGSKLSTVEAIGDIGDDISINAKFAVGGVDQYVQILAIIRRVEIIEAQDEGSKDLHVYGLEFVFVEENERLVLHGFVYEQLSKQ
ncbi:MAG: flagellar brake protein [Gammaproteobacteria bacterium]